MALGTLRTLAHDIVDSVHGVPIVITRSTPDDEPVATTGVWVRERDEAPPFGTEQARRQPRKVLLIQRTAALSEIPRGSIIAAPELDSGQVLRWEVQGYDGPLTTTRMRVVLKQKGETLA